MTTKPNTDTIVRTSVALVAARHEVSRIRAEMGALRCIYEFGPIDARGFYTAPAKRDECYRTTKTQNVWEIPCWKLVPGDGAGEEPYPIGEVSSEGWCDACAAREKLRPLLRAARVHAGAIARGHGSATRAHMRRLGILPEPVKKPERPLYASDEMDQDAMIATLAF